MAYFFTSESVSEGHPDKVADQISDAILDEFLKQDEQSKVACETLVTTGLVVLSGEVRSEAYVDVQKTARDVIRNIGYTKGEYMFEANSCGVLSAIHEQSPDINQGVVREREEDQGAGDQGMMFGYACSDTEDLMPLSLQLSQMLVYELAQIRKQAEQMTYLRPDSKSQVTIEYNDDNTPKSIDAIVISTQHDDFDTEENMLKRIEKDVREILIPRVVAKLHKKELKELFDKEYKLYVNPTGKFVIGGPHGDTGLTGRKIIVDTYGGRAAHGGGAFSGKDSSKVDRSAAYAARHIAKNMVASGLCSEALVQVAYAIGEARPVSLYVNTYGKSHVAVSDSEIAKVVENIFDMRPAAIERRLKLRQPIYEETAADGHMGRKPQTIVKHFKSVYNGDKDIEVELFTWEKLDYVDAIRKAFNL